jgi:hypothetical protein
LFWTTITNIISDVLKRIEAVIIDN